MKRLFPALRHGLQDSVLLRTAIAMGVLALLSLGSIVISAVIADDISGRANAVNVSGSLRFLSYRTLSEVLQPERRAQASDTIKVFERRLLGLERFLRSKSRSENPSHSLRAVQTLLQRWNTQVRILELAAARGDPGAVNQLALEIPAFVDQIDQVVHLIEVELEHQASWLRVVQLVLLGCIVVVSLLTIWLLHSQLVQPLAQLLEAARTVSQGSFSTRVAHVGEDELGRVGQAFNAMVGEIAAMYTHLADKVEEKTRELQRTNESLELLYRVSQKLSASDLTLDQVQEVLREVEVALELGHSMICVSENNQLPAHTVSGDLSLEERHALCSRRDCGECFLNAQQPLLEQGRTSSALLIVPIGDGDHLRGVLPVLKVQDQGLPLEKARIIETVGHHVSNALINMRRAEEKHRLAVMEERSVIARELHDSIAQSLAFLKIQAQLLRDAIAKGRDAARDQSLAELDAGVRECYADVRELLVHFRTRTQDEDIEEALRVTLSKFEHQSGLPAELTMAGQGLPLAPDVQIQVLHIVQEALSNVRKHAGARSVQLVVQRHPQWRFEVRDDGQGFDPAAVPPDSLHVGLGIMRERAERIGARISLDTQAGQGTCVTLELPPAGREAPGAAATMAAV